MHEQVQDILVHIAPVSSQNWRHDSQMVTEMHAGRSVILDDICDIVLRYPLPKRHYLCNQEYPKNAGLNFTSQIGKGQILKLCIRKI